MPECCEFCRHTALEPVYVPEDTQRGLSVFLCPRCGLVQSLPRIDRAVRQPMAVSGGADWGNIRYGKGFHTKPMLAALAAHVDFSAPLKLLDVGSNRGSFAAAFLDAAPNAALTAVEPDERVAQSCAGLPRCTLIELRIEDATLEDESFDIVHSSHTVEHLAHPFATMRDHWRVLKPGGILVIAGPNIELIGEDDVVEEWFIDKHLTHFSARTLGRMIEAAGFRILTAPDPTDRENLLFVAVKAAPASDDTAPDADEVERARRLVACYRDNLTRNRAALRTVAQGIAALTDKGVAMWGAGRIFDALVRYGGFDAKSLVALIDAPLKRHVEARFGQPLSNPEALTAVKPGVVVVMSRGFAQEIETQAGALAPQAEIVRYSDLLEKARRRAV